MDDPATPHADTTHTRADDGAAEQVKLGVIDVVAPNVGDAHAERTSAHEGGEEMPIIMGEGDVAGPRARHRFPHMIEEPLRITPRHPINTRANHPSEHDAPVGTH